MEPLPQAWTSAWEAASAHPALALPMLNPFTPRNLSMLPESEASSNDEPVSIVNDEFISF